MDSVLVVYKKRGETPLQCIERLRKEQAEYKDAVLSYAGRLDPMAEGVLLVLVGEENKKREKYLNLEKEYTFDVLFGFSTDTYDILGKLTDAPLSPSGQAISKTTNARVSMKAVLDNVSAMRGKREQKYPPYSSKRVEGKPLFEWAREGKLDEITIPKHKIEIFSSAFISMRTIQTEDLWSQIDENTSHLEGDFRQKEIRNCWWEHLRPLYGEVFDVATIHVHSSSGTYVRILAHDLGKKIGIPTLALEIVRTRVGEHIIQEKNE